MDGSLELTHHNGDYLVQVPWCIIKIKKNCVIHNNKLFIISMSLVSDDFVNGMFLCFSKCIKTTVIINP